ncbi:hypothetical protein [Spirillospora sp. CA-128828]|uniref:hypothetical protein n=1 Tax=Spirillospora sp. CA-128828 TaxID=3240033 RepID=UPI003D8C754E
MSRRQQPGRGIIGGAPTAVSPTSAAPSSDPRNDAGARRQKATFFKTGTVVDVCGGGPCVITP